MPNKPLQELTNPELLAEAKKLKPFTILNAFFIGFLIAIVAFSIYHKSFSFLMAIPLYFIYSLINNPRNKRRKEIDRLLKERNLDKP
ncbi:MAG: hypothetical protein SFU21_13025 [Flavihumibacter sp.]|nr:hypothetical protein [Flavihumibacter sp.]